VSKAFAPKDAEHQNNIYKIKTTEEIEPGNNGIDEINQK
jgi:hypothetical protein